MYQRIKSSKFNLSKSLVTSELEKRFEDAGNPLGLTAVKFQIYRYSIFLIWLFLTVLNVYNNPTLDQFRTVYQLGSPFLFLLFISSTRRRSILSRFLRRAEQIHNSKKNQEVFLLYAMISDEMRESKGLAKNLETLLSELKDYTPLIRPSINKGLRMFRLGTSYALGVIGESIGTDEAKEVCKILGDLEKADFSNINESIAAREDTYTASLRENLLKRRSAFGNIAYAIVFAPVGIYMFNCINIIMQYMKMITKTNMLN